MNILGNLKVGTKIISGYVIALFLMVVVAGIAIIRLNQINASFIDLTGNLVEDSKLSANMVEQIYRTRLFANRYVLGGAQADLDQTEIDLKALEDLIIQADESITHEERVELLDSVNTNTVSYRSAFEEIEGLITERHTIQAETLDVQAALAQEKLQTLQENAFAAGDLEAVHYAGQAQMALQRMRVNAFKYLSTGDVQWFEKEKDRYAEAQLAFTQLNKLSLETSDRGLVTAAKVAVDAYYFGFQPLAENFQLQQDLMTNGLDVYGPAARTAATEISDSVNADMAIETENTNTLVVQTRLWILGTVLAATLIGLALGFTISRGITAPLNQVKEVARQIAEIDLSTLESEMELLAQGDLTRSLSFQVKPLEIRSRDEVGEMATTFNTMVVGLQNTGKAFSFMVDNLRGIVGKVTDNANSVGAASEQLASAANQAGLATGQIATTIQQVAKGTSQQSESVSRTATSVDQMSRAIEGVSKGAQDQIRAVSKAAELTTQITNAIQHVSANAQAGAKALKRPPKLPRAVRKSSVQRSREWKPFSPR